MATTARPAFKSPTAPPDEQLAPHFWLSEFTDSQTALRRGLDNTPSYVQVQQLRRLAAMLEQVRKLLGTAPIIITSGFRSSRLNLAVGGSEKSLHMQGCAADFIAPAFGSPLEICRLIDANGSIDFAELIYERGWVHLAIQPDLAARQPRRVMTAIFRGGGQKTLYVPGLQEV